MLKKDIEKLIYINCDYDLVMLIKDFDDMVL